MLKLACTLLFANLSLHGLAQADTSVLAQVSDIKTSPYFTNIKGAAALYNGFEYVGGYVNVKGSPFFNADDFTVGKVWYDGVLYSDVPMKYDVVKNELVIKSFQNESMSLINQKTDSFLVTNHLFVRMMNDSMANGMPGEDFYDVLYNGQTRLLVKRVKAISKALHAEDPSKFAVYDSYYILKDGEYQKVNNKKDVLKLLSNKKSSLKSFLKANHIKLKKDFENDLLKTVKYYDR